MNFISFAEVFLKPKTCLQDWAKIFFLPLLGRIKTRGVRRKKQKRKTGSPQQNQGATQCASDSSSHCSCVSGCVFLHVCMCVPVCVHVCMTMCVCVCAGVYIYVCLFTCMSVCGLHFVLLVPVGLPISFAVQNRKGQLGS